MQWFKTGSISSHRVIVENLNGQVFNGNNRYRKK